MYARARAQRRLSHAGHQLVLVDIDQGVVLTSSKSDVSLPEDILVALTTKVCLWLL